MYRGRGNWRHYHHQYFSNERDGRPHRRRSHLDDVFFPNYEDYDDLTEPDFSDVTDRQHERYHNRDYSRWDDRHRNRHGTPKKESRMRCFTSIKSHTSTSKDCAANNETSDDCKEGESKHRVVPKVEEPRTNSACDELKDTLSVKGSSNDPQSSPCDKIKDLKNEESLNLNTRRGNESVTLSAADKTNETINKQTDQISDKIIEARGDGGVLGQTESESVAKPKAEKDCNKAITECHDVNQEKTDDRSSIHNTSLTTVDLDLRLDNVSADSTLATNDNDICENGKAGGSSMDCTSIPVPAEPDDILNDIRVSPAPQPNCQGLREIESDEETVCYDEFITLDNIDTTKSYLSDMGPEFDDYRVVDMTMSTPSPMKRSRDDSNDSSTSTKKTRYDHLYAEINSDQILSEINNVLREDRQGGESASAKCAQRCRSKSLSGMPSEKKQFLSRSRSLESMDESLNEMTYNFDLKTNLLMLLTPPKIDYSSSNEIASPEAATDCDISHRGISSDPTGENNGNQKECKTEIFDDKTDKAVKKETDAAIAEIVSGISEDTDLQKEDPMNIVSVPVSEENQTRKDVKSEIEPNQEAATRTAVGTSDACTSKGTDHQSAPPVDKRMNNSDQEEQKNKNDQKKDVDLRYKPYSYTGGVRNAAGISESDKRMIEAPRKERRPSDDAKRSPGTLKSHQAGKSDLPKKPADSSSLVRYSDYKKSVDLSKKSPPPEMHLCTIMGYPNKLTQRRMTFSSEEELHLQKMHKLFGSESENEEDETNSDKCDKGKSFSKKRKDEREHGVHKREPPLKKQLSVSSNKQSVKEKSLDKHRRYSTPGHSGGVVEREVSKSTYEKQCPTNNDSRSKNQFISKLKNRENKRRISGSTASSGSDTASNLSNKNKSATRQISKPVSLGATGDRNSQKIPPEKCDKPGDALKKTAQSNISAGGFSLNSKNGRKDDNLKCFKGNTSPKSDSRANPSVTEYPDMLIEDINRKKQKNNWPRDKECKPQRPIDQISRRDTPIDEAKAEIPGEMQGQGLCQKQLSPSKTSSDNRSPSNSASQLISSSTFQPRLVLKRIDDQDSSDANVMTKEQCLRRAIESCTLEPMYVKCFTLCKDRFPMMQKIRFTFSINECCDKAVRLDSPEVTDKVEVIKQQVTDDVIEIIPDIPIIDLTDDGEKSEDPPKAEAFEKKEDAAVNNASTTGSEERITLYRSDETLNNTLEVQAMVASITSTSLIDDGDHKKCEAIKTDAEPVDQHQELDCKATTPVGATVERIQGASPQIVQKTSQNVFSSMTETRNLLEKQNIDTNRTVNRPQDKRQTVSVSGTYIPQNTPAEDTQVMSSLTMSNANSHQNAGVPIPILTIVANKNSLGRPTYSIQANYTSKSTVQNPRNDDKVSAPSDAVAQSLRRSEADSNQIAAGFVSGPVPRPRHTENNDISQNTFVPAQTPRRETNPTSQTSFTATTQSPRRIECNASEQGFVATASAYSPRLMENHTTPTANINWLPWNSRTGNGVENQNFYAAVQAPRRTVINNVQMSASLTQSARANGSYNEYFSAAAQLPRRTEINNGQSSAGSGPRAQNFFVGPAATIPRRSENNANHVTSGDYNACADQSVSEQQSASLVRQSPRRINDELDVPLRSLRQLVNAPEPPPEISDSDMTKTGFLLVRYLYYFDGLKKAQHAYTVELQKLNRSLPSMVKDELAQFEKFNFVNNYKLSKDLVRDLRSLNIKSPASDVKLQKIMEIVNTTIKFEVPTFTISWQYLVLDTLMQPETNQYMEVPFLRNLYNFVMFVKSAIYSRKEMTRHQGTVQNNRPPQDLLSAKQRKLLIRQLQEYQKIRTNQVSLILQNNMQNNVADVQSRMRLNCGGLVQDQCQPVPVLELQERTNPQMTSLRQMIDSVPYAAGEVISPPNVTLSNNNNTPMVRESGVAQQTNACVTSTRETESITLKNLLSSHGSKKKPGKVVSRANSTSQLKFGVHKDVLNPTNSSNASTFPPRRNQPDVVSNDSSASAKGTTGTTLRRNSSPNIPVYVIPKGANDNFRIRLPFTMPYDINPSSPTTTTTAVSPRGQGQPVPEAPSMPLLDGGASPVCLPNLSHIQNVARTPVYAPIAFTHPITRSPSPAAEATEQSTQEAVQAPETSGNDDVQAGISEGITEDDSLTIKSETEAQLTDKDIETIDLTWIDDIDPEQLENEILHIGVKKEEPVEEEITEEASNVQEPVAVWNIILKKGCCYPGAGWNL